MEKVQNLNNSNTAPSSKTFREEERALLGTEIKETAYNL
jgi:hypothetical protein